MIDEGRLLFYARNRTENTRHIEVITPVCFSCVFCYSYAVTFYRRADRTADRMLKVIILYARIESRIEIKFANQVEGGGHYAQEN